MENHNRTCIIDDDAIAIFGLKRALKSIGFTPDLSVFENGLEALEKFEKLLENGSELPSLIFIDLNMPVMDGWDFMEEFTKLIPSQKDMPEIYIMTSSMDFKDVEKAKTYGLEDNYLIKPISKEVLEGIVGSLLPYGSCLEIKGEANNL
ncbi:Response regulator receiver domain-containing protein [Pricia antarctica]|uniref:Response regulator receiver domain-containing protein n=1 Tax=Pricia antarctica TaxID=641691 RepID=A0A1G7H6G4_9FLAO|nr:response regulator [Pricia antarctica]SDE95854.1 Response regulator receiver domain-containing protein [Pricia antarctica]